MICPKCGKEEEFLEAIGVSYARAYPTVEFNEDEIDYQEMEVDYSDAEYLCPNCHEVVAITYEDAALLLRKKDE
jgi:hypothetical protein